MGLFFVVYFISFAKFAIKMISKFFNKKELNDIITACYYSVFYYNADISISSIQTKIISSIIPSIENRNKKLWQNNIILKAALKRKQSNTRKNMPVQTLLLHKIYNDIDQGAEWLALNFNQNFNNRNPKF